MTAVQRMLIAQEGLELMPYTDTVGKWTIGVGRNLTDKGISKDEAMALLSSDIADAIDDIYHLFSCYDNLSEARQQVLISMAFNLGRTRLSTFTRFIGAVHRSDWEDAADEMMDSTWAKQVGVRAVTLSRMMRHSTSEWI